MSEQGTIGTRLVLSRMGRHSLVVVLLALVGACEEPAPRSYVDFMEDRIAREGTLARCNDDRNATLTDIECANARRAASAIALRRERERRETLERESERKLTELRDQMARREQAAREAALEQAAAEREAYEALWRNQNAAAGADAAAAAGEPEPGDGLGLIEVPNISRLDTKPEEPKPSLEQLSTPRPFRGID